jgi:predicted helicase
MSEEVSIKASHKAIKAYYADMEKYRDLQAEHEGAVSMAFLDLLKETAKRRGWTPIHQETIKTNGRSIRPDAVLRDEWGLPHGYWEAKDSQDDLDAEIRKKLQVGYPTSNIIFEDTREAVLFQGGREVVRADLSQPDELARLLSDFLSYAAPSFEQFERAVAHFQEVIPKLAEGLNARIKEAHAKNQTFQASFAALFELCRNSLNPNISRDAVDEMLIQHLLTERLIRRVFDNPEFVRRNVIASEIEKVIGALTSAYFNRTEFLGALDRFYEAIEEQADNLQDFSEKQGFLNKVYERFFQGYSVKVADTHGIIYTPQEIVEFMCSAVEEVLASEFGLRLGDEGVDILDPATGTGSFIVNLMQRVPRQHLPRVYREQLFANEVMLMPYYIASLNIEHEFYNLTGSYEPFEGLCFVDTLDLAEGRQMRMAFMTEENAERVERQKQTPITVIIGNPPYNIGQINENDNNKNRAYEIIDKRVSETYAKDSNATNKNALSDAYVKFYRWATDRLGDRNGIVCFIRACFEIKESKVGGARNG